MRKLLRLYLNAINTVKKTDSISLLLLRFVLAYGFLTPAMLKWKDIGGIADWFGQIGIPFPLLNAYLAASTETLGVVLLTAGFGTRIISIPLIITMMVAIKTVHLTNGFEAGNNGFEIPLYYIIMLLILIVRGAGNISFDHFVSKKLHATFLPGKSV